MENKEVITVQMDKEFYESVVLNAESGGGGSAPSKPKYTGHADVEGLRAIGWTDEDIAYYQEDGVNWDEEDDKYHLVTDDNKALYGVLTIDNISTYKDRIIYLPKIDTSNVTSMDYKFKAIDGLIAIPQLDTANVTTMVDTFFDCVSLRCIPPLDTSNVTSMSNCFYNCYSLTKVRQLDTSKTTNINALFGNCISLQSLPPSLSFAQSSYVNSVFLNCYLLKDCSQLILHRSVYNISFMFDGATSLETTPLIEGSGLNYIVDAFKNCWRLTNVFIAHIRLNCDLSFSNYISKESILYLINNEAASKAITIKLATYAYEKWATDADVVAALANHPNISLAK
jgi:hypothetical protein